MKPSLPNAEPHAEENMSYVASYKPVSSSAYLAYADPMHLLDAVIKGFVPATLSVTEAVSESSLSKLLRENDLANAGSWREYVSNRAAPTDKKTLKETSDRVLRVLTERGVQAIDLGLVRREEVSGKHLALALRCIATWKKEVPGWERALEIAKDALVAEGRDPRGALFGML